MWDSTSHCLWESCSSVSMLCSPHDRQCRTWGLQLWAGNTLSQNWQTACSGETIPYQLHKGRTKVVRCRLPVVIQKLYRVMCIQLQATSFRATKRAKSAIQAKRECGQRGNKKQQVTYPQSIQLIVPRPFTSWATLDSNLSELSAAAAGRNKKIKVTNSIITPQRRIQWCIPLFWSTGTSSLIWRDC